MRTVNEQIRSYCLVFVVVAIVCLVPVALLYLLFKGLNLFALQGTWKGVFGAGPIAAYVFLYVLSLRYVLKFLKLGGPLMDEKKVRELEEAHARETDLPIEIPRVGGSWKGTWPWTDEESGETTTYEERVEIEQHGREITGTIKDDSGQESAFRGSIFARMITFYFVSKKESRLSCGSVTVRVSADGDSLNGHQIYYDLELEKLESTEYNLTKI